MIRLDEVRLATKRDRGNNEVNEGYDDKPDGCTMLRCSMIVAQLYSPTTIYCTCLYMAHMSLWPLILDNQNIAFSMNDFLNDRRKLRKLMILCKMYK